MLDLHDLELSRQHEMRVYLDSLTAMYSNAMAQNGEVYDIAAELTEDFTNITGSAVLRDSRIIKILRYAIAPSISQMKFGQFFSLNSIDIFEKDRLIPGTGKYHLLSELADDIANFACSRIDSTRFIWLGRERVVSDMDLAREFAKGWTCSIAADQNAQTKYRNWRKDQQEHAIASMLVQLGYTRSGFSGVVTKKTDMNIGEFRTETRVEGRTRQKADVVVRSKKGDNNLVLIEAKAVGVELDSTKRIKECCDKANDWASSGQLDNPVVSAVIAGFFTATGIASLQASEIRVVWEHRLSDLSEFL